MCRQNGSYQSIGRLIIRLATILVFCLPVVLAGKHSAPDLISDAQILYRYDGGAIIQPLRDIWYRAETGGADQKAHLPTSKIPELGSGPIISIQFRETFVIDGNIRKLPPRARSPPAFMTV